MYSHKPRQLLERHSPTERANKRPYPARGPTMASWRKQSLRQDPKGEEEPTRQRQAEEGRKSVPGRGNSTCRGRGGRQACGAGEELKPGSEGRGRAAGQASGPPRPQGVLLTEGTEKPQQGLKPARGRGGLRARAVGGYYGPVSEGGWCFGPGWQDRYGKAGGQKEGVKEDASG